MPKYYSTNDTDAAVIIAKLNAGEIKFRKRDDDGTQWFETLPPIYGAATDEAAADDQTPELDYERAYDIIVAARACGVSIPPAAGQAIIDAVGVDMEQFNADVTAWASELALILEEPAEPVNQFSVEQ